MVHNVKLGKNMRSVSIVGIGATPFFNGVQNETYKGLTNGELFGHAALDAMKDAGVEPRDVQYFFHGSANPHVLNNCITPNLQVADWFGMRGKRIIISFGRLLYRLHCTGGSSIRSRQWSV